MYAFGEFVVDPRLYQLRRGEQTIPLEPKVFDVLRYLVEHADRVITKRELFAELWSNEVVTEAVLPTNISALRRALGQRRGDKEPIETVHGRGYRFASPVVRRLADAELVAPAEGVGARAHRDVPLLGQRPLFDRMRRLLALALEGRGQICMLGGEAGIGKTRLAQRFAQAAQVAGAEVWKASCEDACDAPPLWALRQLLRSALECEGPATLGAYVDELALLLPCARETPDNPAWLGMSDEQAALRLYDALRNLLLSAGPSRPRLIWLEAMERADELSWQLLCLLAPSLERAAVMVLITVRSRDDLSAVLPVQRHLDQLQALAHASRFLVRGLELSQVHELSRRLLGADVAEELTHALHETSGGNPLLVRELVAWLNARGERDAGALQKHSAVSSAELMRQLQRRRVLRLGAHTKQLLEVAAVIGPVWEASTVERVGMLGGDVCEAVWQVALNAGVIAAVEPGSERFRFVDDMLRETLYDDLPMRDRRRLHGSVAAVLEERVASLGLEGVRAVASHLHRALPDAADPLHAQAWLERAAQLCEQRASYREAAQLYRRALDAARLLRANPSLGGPLVGGRGVLRSAPAQS